MENRVRSVREEQGFALVLAMLSLMLLTFLGLTLAATTSTELQIATNYRWSQQALYNAEAGLDAARLGLSELVVREPTRKWAAVLPEVRTAPSKTWFLGDAPPPLVGAPAPWVLGERDFEKASCDERSGVGYGIVLNTGFDSRTGVVGRDGVQGRYLEVSSFAGHQVNGAFTVWIRRNVIDDPDGTGAFQDDEENDSMVLVSEGVAPFTRSDSAFARTRQAVRVLETRYRLDVRASLCRNEPGQEGGGPTGEGYNACAALYSDQIQDSLGTVFGPNVRSLGVR